MFKFLHPEFIAWSNLATFDHSVGYMTVFNFSLLFQDKVKKSQVMNEINEFNQAEYYKIKNEMSSRKKLLELFRIIYLYTSSIGIISSCSSFSDQTVVL